MQFDYYSGRQAEQFAFFQIPKILIVDERFEELSLDAKLLYSIMLDRVLVDVLLFPNRNKFWQIKRGIAENKVMSISSDCSGGASCCIMASNCKKKTAGKP